MIIETAAGLAHVEEIAASSPRMQAMSLGPADFAAFMGMQTTAIGGTQANYYMIEDPREDKGPRAISYPDPWHHVTVAIVAACRTHGVLPVDGPFGDFSDPEGFKAQARRSATLGMVGKWAIHPSQVAMANEIFTPSDASVSRARRVLDAMEDAKKSGAGAVALDGKLIDLASIRQAQVIVAHVRADRRGVIPSPADQVGEEGVSPVRNLRRQVNCLKTNCNPKSVYRISTCVNAGPGRASAWNRLRRLRAPRRRGAAV